MTRTLVIQLARLGDLLQSLPLCQALRAEGELHLALSFDPGRRLRREADRVIVLEPWSVARAAAHPGSFLRRVRDALGEGGLSALRKRPYDRVVCLNEDQSALALARLIPGRRRLGAGASGDPYARWLRVMGSRRPENRLQLAEAMLAMLPGRVSPAPAPEPAGEGDLLLHPGSGSVHRSLPVRFWVELAGALAKRCERRIVMTGSVAERTLCAEIEAGLGRPDRLLNLSGSTDLDELGELISASALLIAQDTGVLHLAAHLRRPVLGLYHGSAWPWETAPWLAGAQLLQARAECAPCLEGPATCGDRPCRAGLRPTRVAELAVSMLVGAPVVIEDEGCAHLVALADRGGLRLVRASEIGHAPRDEERDRQLAVVRGIGAGTTLDEDHAASLEQARLAGMTVPRWRERTWAAQPRSLAEEWSWRREAEILGGG